MERVMCCDLKAYIGNAVTIKGWAHRVRSMGGIRFVLVRDRTGVAQVIASGTLAKEPALDAEAVVEVTGAVSPSPLECLNVTCLMACLRVFRSRGRRQASLSPEAQDAEGSDHRVRTCETVRRERITLRCRLGQDQAA